MKSNKRKYLLMALFILLGITISFAQKNEKSFNIGNNGQIVVDISYGDIKIDTWDKSQISVKYGEDESGSSFRFVQNGNTLNITSGDDPDEDLSLTVPASINLDLTTAGGDVKINDNINGKVECNTEGGDIKTKDINGNASLNTSGGEVTAGKINGDALINSGGGDLKLGVIIGKADLVTGGGNVGVSDVKKDLKVKTGGGNVNAGNVEGELAVTTGGGNVDVIKVSNSVSVTTGGGNITLSGSKGKTKVTTGGGNIILKNSSGAVKSYTGSGDVYVELTPDPKMNSEIKSGSGSITFYIPSDAKATIIAKVRGYDRWGDNSDSPIISDFKLSTEDKSSNSLKTVYVINGGGSEIEIETSSGEIHIEKMK